MRLHKISAGARLPKIFRIGESLGTASLQIGVGEGFLVIQFGGT